MDSNLCMSRFHCSTVDNRSASAAEAWLPAYRASPRRRSASKLFARTSLCNLSISDCRACNFVCNSVVAATSVPALRRASSRPDFTSTSFVLSSCISSLWAATTFAMSALSVTMVSSRSLTNLCRERCSSGDTCDALPLCSRKRSTSVRCSRSCARSDTNSRISASFWSASSAGRATASSARKRPHSVERASSSALRAASSKEAFEPTLEESACSRKTLLFSSSSWNFMRRTSELWPAAVSSRSRSCSRKFCRALMLWASPLASCSVRLSQSASLLTNRLLERSSSSSRVSKSAFAARSLAAPSRRRSSLPEDSALTRPSSASATSLACSSSPLSSFKVVASDNRSSSCRCAPSSSALLAARSASACPRRRCSSASKPTMELTSDSNCPSLARASCCRRCRSPPSSCSCAARRSPKAFSRSRSSSSASCLRRCASSACISSCNSWIFFERSWSSFALSASTHSLSSRSNPWRSEASRSLLYEAMAWSTSESMLARPPT
mmetsp:Transcript_164448/g.527394  ORF Transcript_164448/g.527394 Transcript_164448/m.527394 type:complete len:498 (+) Transcript_164448:1211-2704(+)